MTNVEALKALYHALGGDLDDVADVNTIVGVLNAISAKFDGADDAELNAQGIANITDIIGNITADLTALDVTPTTEAQNIKPTAPIDGYNEVNVSAVTAAIDSNITAGNIKKDVQILGVTGSYEGSGGETFEVILAYSEDQEHNPVFTPNKTFAETVSAIQNGKAIVLKIRYDNSGTIIDRYAACFYEWFEQENINAIYFPYYMTSSSINGYIWDNNGFGASSFNGTITVNP